MLRHSNLVRTNKENRERKNITAKKLIFTVRRKTLRRARLRLVEILPLFAAAFFVFLRRLSSSEFEARSSDSYSWTTNQPSLLRSAILINFFLLRMICSASCTKLRTWLESSALVLIREKRLSSLAFTSNCYLLPLNLRSEADLSNFAWSSISFPELCIKISLKWGKSSSTNSELWGLGISGASFSFVPSTKDSEATSQRQNERQSRRKLERERERSTPC